MKPGIKAFLQGNYFLLRNKAGGKAALFTFLFFILYSVAAYKSCSSVPKAVEINEELYSAGLVEINEEKYAIEELVTEKELADKIRIGGAALGISQSKLDNIPLESYIYDDEALSYYCNNHKLFRLINSDDVIMSIRYNAYFTKILIVMIIAIAVFRVLLLFLAGPFTKNKVAVESSEIKEITEQEKPIEKKPKDKKPVGAYIATIIIPLLGPLFFFLVLHFWIFI